MRRAFTLSTQSPLADQQSVRENIQANAAFNSAYAIMNGLAAVVASYGLLQDSSAVVIGAMIIATLLGPITGMALGLVEGDNRLLHRALLAEVGGCLIVLAIAFVIGKIHHNIPFGKEILGRTAPNILDLVIALAAGAAGAYAVVTPRLSAGLVGVAIATALVPPLCVCALCLSRGMIQAGSGAFLLFLTNLVAIQCATSLVLWLQGFRPRVRLRRWELFKRFGLSALLLFGLAVFLGYSLHNAVAREALRSQAETYLQREIEKNGAAHLAEVRIRPADTATDVIAVVRAPWVITPKSCARLQTELRHFTKRDDVTLHIRTILTRECDANGFLWNTVSEYSDVL